MAIDLTYVPGYLVNVERQSDGWPTTITKEEKDQIVEAVREVLLQNEALSLDDIYRRIEDKVPVLKEAVVWDFIFACVHRALCKIGEPVYRLNDHERCKAENPDG